METWIMETFWCDGDSFHDPDSTIWYDSGNKYKSNPRARRMVNQQEIEFHDMEDHGCEFDFVFLNQS